MNKLKIEELDEDVQRALAVRSLAAEKIVEAIQMLTSAGMPDESEEIQLLSLAGYQLTECFQYIQTTGDPND